VTTERPEESGANLEAEAAAAARWRKVERVFCARLLNEQVRLLEANGHHEAAVAVRLVVRLLARLDGE
jgi:hypothetical protein